MLFPTDFWPSFALLVGGGMVVAFVLGALTSRVQSRGSRTDGVTAVDALAEARLVDASQAQPRGDGLGGRVRSECPGEAGASAGPVMSGGGAGG